MKSDRRPEEPALEPRLKKLLCKRIDQQVDLAEHERCPYCYGTRTELARGRHETFCDYDPKRDPVHFGFPERGSRDLEG